MAEFSGGKPNQQAEADNDIIDLVDESDDEDTSLLDETTKKRSLDSDDQSTKVPGQSDVVDLLDDDSATSASDSSFDAGTNHDNPAANRKKRPRTTTSSSNETDTTVDNAIGVEIVDLLDSSDDSEPENRDPKTDSGSAATTTTNAANASHRTAQHLVLDPYDNAKLTQGILNRIHDLTKTSENYCWTCLGSNGTASEASAAATANEKTNDDDDSSSVAVTSDAVAHIQQRDDWSCGYRNHQMLLSALLPRLKESPHHSVFKRLPRRLPPTPMSLPSLTNIQKAMDEAWEEGFDPDGADHYRHSILGKSGASAKIGAMEVANLFWYHGIDATVIQFIKCAESRSLLPLFVLAYLARTATVGNDMNEFDQYSTILAKNVLSEATRLSTLSPSSISSLLRTINANSMFSTKASSLLPLYLQWEGHSVTVVGIEACGLDDQNESSSSSLLSWSPNLLVLDPLKDSWKLKSDLSLAMMTMASSYPKKDSLPAFAAVLPWKKIASKDLQIIVCTGRSMTYSERETCKIGESGGNTNHRSRQPPQGRVLTAAQDAVQRHP